MSRAEARFREVTGLTEGDTVLVTDGPETSTGTVVVVGWRTGTFRVRVGRRIRHVSVTQVRKP